MNRLPDALSFARFSPAGLARYASGGRWQFARHLDPLNRALKDLATRRETRVIVDMPPRHGKSEMVSKYLPAWWAGKFPDDPMILTSYEAGFAATWGAKARDLLNDVGPAVFGVKVHDDASARDDWRVAGHDGAMRTAGIGGAITGRGARLFIIDDPVKNAEEAMSETYREKAWDWFLSTAYTRLEPDAVMVIIMTRWHEDDLVGRILRDAETSGEKWKVIHLPAIADGPDLLGRTAGEALWPERYPVERLEIIKNRLKSYWWNALYQGRPSAVEGNLFKRSWWKFFTVRPTVYDEIITSWDMAFKDMASSDYVVGQVWGRIGADCYLLEQVRGQLDFPATVRAVMEVVTRWPWAHLHLIEDKANGPAVIQTLRNQLAGMVAVNPMGGKVSRASAVSPKVESGNVHLPDPSVAAWIEQFIDEAASFPKGAHDDSVDAMTQALIRLENRAEMFDLAMKIV